MKCLLFTILILLSVSAKIKCRSSKLSAERSQLVEAMNHLAAEKAAEGIDSDRLPLRLSPGGPDPHHHFKHDWLFKAVLKSWLVLFGSTSIRYERNQYIWSIRFPLITCPVLLLSNSLCSFLFFFFPYVFNFE